MYSCMKCISVIFVMILNCDRYNFGVIGKLIEMIKLKSLNKIMVRRSNCLKFIEEQKLYVFFNKQDLNLSYLFLKTVVNKNFFSFNIINLPFNFKIYIVC